MPRIGDLGAREPYKQAAAVTPHDTNAITATDALYVGTAGTLKVTMENGDVSFGNVTAGSLLPIRATVVFSTGTSASNIVALRYGT